MVVFSRHVSQMQVVSFVLEQSSPTSVCVLQVVYDGEDLKPVVGGYQVTLDNNRSHFTQRFGLDGEYKFIMYAVLCSIT